VCTATGWRWNECEEDLDLPRLRWFRKTWKKHPPVHQSVAAYLGIGRDKTSTPLADSAGAILDDLMGAAPKAP
jgi:hypothetical protein